MYIALLGRQPALGIAELERVFGGSTITPLSHLASLVQTDMLDIQSLGGILKAGKVTLDLPSTDWRSASQKIVHHYAKAWSSFDGKITLGISAYDFTVSPRDVQKIGLMLKQSLKKSGVSMRLVPNQDNTLSSATSHHNKLGLSPNKVELIIVRGSKGRVIVAESTGAQNITAYARRDQERPKRDAFVGMLPPKLAQMMINLAVGIQPVEHQLNILDPFCGTGVILQEGLIKGYSVYGSDLNPKMISYTTENLEWLQRTHPQADGKIEEIRAGDATDYTWLEAPHLDAVVAETYLGQPFSAPPSPSKLEEVRKNCNGIISDFLRNIGKQLQPGTPVCIAIPAWKRTDGSFSHLPLIETIAQLGFKPHEFHNVSQKELLYYREDQVVARELLVLTKI